MKSAVLAIALVLGTATTARADDPATAQDAGVVEETTAPAPTATIPVPTPEDEPTINDIKKAYDQGDILLAVMLGLYFLIKLVKLGLGHLWDWPNTKWGGATLAFGMSSLLPLILIIKQEMSLTLPVVLTVMLTAWGSSGLHGHVKDWLESRTKSKSKPETAQAT